MFVPITDWIRAKAFTCSVIYLRRAYSCTVVIETYYVEVLLHYASSLFVNLFIQY